MLRLEGLAQHFVRAGGRQIAPCSRLTPAELEARANMNTRRFIVSCLHCKRVVMVVAQVAGEELNRLRSHLLSCCPNEMIGPSPGVEATLRHFRVVPTDRGEPPPVM